MRLLNFLAPTVATLFLIGSWIILAYMGIAGWFIIILALLLSVVLYYSLK